VKKKTGFINARTGSVENGKLKEKLRCPPGVPIRGWASHEPLESKRKDLGRTLPLTRWVNV